MGSSPKAEGPTESDRANAQIAVNEYNDFRQNYAPLLREMRDQSKQADATNTLRDRANADTMQALTTDTSYARTQDVEGGADISKAYIGQLGQATMKGKEIENKMQSNVLGTARKQAADAQSGMAQAARLSSSEALTKAQAKFETKLAAQAAVAKLATGAVAKGKDNIAGGGTAFTPNMNAGKMNPDGTAMAPRLAKGFKERFSYNLGTN